MQDPNPNTGEDTSTEAAVASDATMTLIAEITVSTDGLAAVTGLRPDHLIPFVQGLVARSLAHYSELVRVAWKPGYRMFVRTIAELLMEGETNEYADPPAPFVNTFDDAVQMLDRLIGDARELFDS